MFTKVQFEILVTRTMGGEEELKFIQKCPEELYSKVSNFQHITGCYL